MRTMLLIRAIGIALNRISSFSQRARSLMITAAAEIAKKTISILSPLQASATPSWVSFIRIVFP